MRSPSPSDLCWVIGFTPQGHWIAPILRAAVRAEWPDAQQIAAAAQEYGAYYVRHKIGAGPENYVVDHSTYLYVMDPRGKFVRAFDTNTSGDRIADALRELLAQGGG